MPEVPAPKIRLLTSTGAYVADIDDIAVALMVQNGTPPAIVNWGTRYFVHEREYTYREGFCCTIGLLHDSHAV